MPKKKKLYSIEYSDEVAPRVGIKGMGAYRGGHLKLQRIDVHPDYLKMTKKKVTKVQRRRL